MHHVTAIFKNRKPSNFEQNLDGTYAVTGSDTYSRQPPTETTLKYDWSCPMALLYVASSVRHQHTGGMNTINKLKVLGFNNWPTIALLHKGTTRST